MPIDAVITAAIVLLAPYVSDVVKGVAEGVGEGAAHGAGRLLKWLRSRLTGQAKAALEDFEAEPRSETRQQVFGLWLQETAATDPTFLEELRGLLPDRSVTQTVSAGGTGVQVVGSGNTTNVRRQ